MTFKKHNLLLIFNLLQKFSFDFEDPNTSFTQNRINLRIKKQTSL